MINNLDPDVLIVSGDLVYEGLMHEYDQAVEYLDAIKVRKKIIIPGNHDARNEGYRLFEEVFEKRFPVYENGVVQILGIDSSEPDISDGHVGRENYSLIEETLSDLDKLRILTLHHHLIPIPGTGRERHIPLDAGDVLKVCHDVGVNLVLSGHKHRPWIWCMEDTYFITAGTATTRRLKGRSYPCFNVLDLEGGELVVTEVNVSDESKKEILRFRMH